jgi:5'-nucleotidase
LKKNSLYYFSTTGVGLIFYCDLDGVLSDFDGRVSEIVGHSNPSYDEVREAMQTPGFFRDLPVLPGGLEAIGAIQALIPGQVRILSAVPYSVPGLAEIARQDKVGWLREHLPDLAESAHIVSDKGTVGTSTDIILDDHIDWNGCDRFPGMKIEFTGPESWAVLIAELNKRINND